MASETEPTTEATQMVRSNSFLWTMGLFSDVHSATQEKAARVDIRTMREEDALMGTDAAVNANAEAIEAWDGPLYDRFVQFREVLIAGLGAHGEVALGLVPPLPGQRVLDIGCGFGDTTQRIAGLVGPEGEVVGVDAAPKFIETARTETAELGMANARFEVADVQVDPLGGPYDLAFSRMGTMFFANPVAAMRNVRSSLVPGG